MPGPESGPDSWRIRVSKLAAEPLPRVLCDTGGGIATHAGPDGLAYLTVHQRRQSIVLGTRP
jgi:hypothetical protein